MGIDEYGEKYLELDTDYLGFLNSQLRNLKGYHILANELIQNAHDAPCATRIVFDVCDDALIVENDGLFSDCGKSDQAKCPWSDDPEKGHKCDLHRFRTTASGDKRRVENAAGAFGIGFISVYQITDHPEVFTAEHHWLLDPSQPSDRRILAKRNSPPLAGTKFRLPWAKEMTSLRKELGTERVPEDIVDRLVPVLMKHLPGAVIFIDKLERYEVRRNGKLLQTVTRSEKNSEVLVTDDKGAHKWHLLMGDFADAADEIKKEVNGIIEKKRSAQITLAFSPEQDVKGFFYALVPTEQAIGLPFHLNADFFPNSDRKSILLDDEYQGHWNQKAIDASAKVIAKKLVYLRDILGHMKLWELVHQIRAVAAADSEDRTTKAFKEFWSTCLPALKDTPIVFSTQGAWLKPTEENIYLLQSLDEKLAVLALEDLSLRITHLDLHPYNNEIRELGVKALDALALLSGIKRAGFDKAVTYVDAPSYVRTEYFLPRIAAEIAVLLDRIKGLKHVYPQAKEELDLCSIAMTSDGWLKPVGQVRTADSKTEETISLLETEGLFVDTGIPEELLSYIGEFDSHDAILILKEMDSDWLNVLWLEDPEAYVNLLGWIADRAIEFDDDLARTFSNLSIWPAGPQLKPLRSLVIPGDFHDELGLTKVIDARVQLRCKEFLTRTLKATPLSLESYLRHYLPQALEEQELTNDVHERLILFLVKEMGRFVDSPDTVEALVSLPIAKCRDGRYFEPRRCYFPSPLVLDILGDTTPIVVINPCHLGVTELFRCLNVAEIPRTHDVAERIRGIIQLPPDGEVRLKIKKIFSCLGLNWHLFSDKQDELEDLCCIAWLPAENDSANWHAPSTIYDCFLKSRFSSQGTFLDIDTKIQNASAKFMEFLEVLRKPTTQKIVRHLLYCSSNGLEIKNDVYSGLNDDSDNPVVQTLCKTKCLHLGSGRYVAPNEVFWENHPFGPYRYQLSDDWRQYYKLLKVIGVDKPPGADDAIAVLKEISVRNGNNYLGEADSSIVYSCWKLLQFQCDEDSDTVAKLKSLSEEKIILNKNRLLTCPKYIFFEDRPQLLDNFDEIVIQYVIPRPEGIWKAMSIAGVRPLSQAVEADAVIRENPQEAEELVSLVKDRIEQLARVFESTGVIDWKKEILDKLGVVKVDNLRSRYHLSIFGQSLFSEPIDLQAFYSVDDETIFLCFDQIPPWAAFARELVYALCPGEEAGKIAPGIKEVLCANSTEEAEQALNELGYAPIQRHTSERVEPAKADLAEDVEEDVAPPETEQKKPPEKPADKPRDKEQKSAPLTNAEDEDKNKETMEFRFFSYVSKCSSGKSNSGEDKSGPIDRAGIAHVLSFEANEGRRAEEQSHSNPGFDIKSYDMASNELVRYIEVKSLSGYWDRKRPVGISSTQYEFGRGENKDLFWLYVVERAQSADANIITIKNPIAHITDYMFDYGWKQAAGDPEKNWTVGTDNAAPISAPKKRSILDLRDKLTPLEETNYDQP